MVSQSISKYLKVFIALIPILLILTSCSKEDNSNYKKGRSYFSPIAIDNLGENLENDSLVIYLTPIFNTIFLDFNEDTIANYFPNGSMSTDTTIYADFLSNNTNYTLLINNFTLFTNYIIKTYPTGISDSLLTENILVAYHQYSDQLEIREDPCKKYKECIQTAKNQAVGVFAIGAVGGVVHAAYGNAIGSLWSFISGTAGAINSYQNDKAQCCDTAAKNANCCE